MEDHEDREVTIDARAIPHLPGAFVLDERSGIENVSHVRQPSTLDPRGIDNVDRESSQPWSINAVPMRFDGVRNESQKINGSYFFGHDAYPFEHASGVRGSRGRNLFRQRLCFGISKLRISRIEQSLLLAPWHLLARLPDVESSPSHS